MLLCSTEAFQPDFAVGRRLAEDLCHQICGRRIVARRQHEQRVLEGGWSAVQEGGLPRLLAGHHAASWDGRPAARRERVLLAGSSDQRHSQVFDGQQAARGLSGHPGPGLTGLCPSQFTWWCQQQEASREEGGFEALWRDGVTESAVDHHKEDVQLVKSKSGQAAE